MNDRDQRGWRQKLTWKSGFRRAQAGRPYSCPWWADKRVYGLAYLHGKYVPPSEQVEALPSEPQPIHDALPTEAVREETLHAEWERLMRELSNLSR
jgi:hypothetical protein